MAQDTKARLVIINQPRKGYLRRVRKMPKKLERCVRKVKQTVKPRKGQTKEQAAFAICTVSTGRKRKRRKK